METLAIALFLSLLKTLIKNPDKAKKLKTRLLLIRDQITLLFPEYEPMKTMFTDAVVKKVTKKK